VTSKTRCALTGKLALLMIWALPVLGTESSDLPVPGQLEGTVANGSNAVGDLPQSYRQALAKLASNDFHGALTTLIDLESRVAASPSSAGLIELRELETKVIDELLPAGTRLLLPVIVLHQEAYRQLRERGLDASASHSRSMALMLSDLYAEQAYEGAAKRVSGDLFASLGGLFRETSSGPMSLRLYRRSLEFDHTNEAALLGTAVAYEQRGKYSTALPFLFRCVGNHPENTEAQLRLAINLDRSGQHTEAIRALEGLLLRRAPDWQLSLAYQELARMFLARGDLVAAGATVHRGLKRFPRSSTLLITLAHVNNLRGSDKEGPEMVQALRQSVVAGDNSPRYLYGQDPRQPLKKVDLRLRLSAARHLSTLGQALSSGRLSGIK